MLSSTGLQRIALGRAIATGHQLHQPTEGRWAASHSRVRGQVGAAQRHALAIAAAAGGGEQALELGGGLGLGGRPGAQLLPTAGSGFRARCRSPARHRG
ncbi:hypothetical protein PEC18_37880 [Paucibacter sp. O1-1]|nr:hypothetical protein [Paucibacter sp. O1-1]MDA3831398.1 hypothetical protein [Paucibacter sp. O1-1]